MIGPWKADLQKEKSLQEVFRASKKFPKSHFNRRLYIAVGTAIALVAGVWVCKLDVNDSARAADLATEIAFDLTVQILGFLIGGFAILATLTDQRLMIRLAQAPMGESGHSVFKYVFFSFLSVFSIYIVTLGVAVAIKLAGSLELFDPRAVLDRSGGRLALTMVNSAAFALLASLISMSIIRLKSFIWNIYQGFIIFLIVRDLMDGEALDNVNEHVGS